MVKHLLFKYLLLLNIAVTAQEYVVTAIDFQGAQKTNTFFLKNLIQTKEKDLLNIDILNNDITRLIRLPVIANAEYKITKKENSCSILFTLKENHTLIPSANFFQTTNKKLAYSFGVSEYNLFKRSISLGAWYQKNIFDSFGINFNAPYLFNPKFGLALNFTHLTTQEPVFFPSGTALYKYNNVSTEVLGLFQFNFNNKIAAGVNFFTETYNANNVTIPEAPESYSLDKTLFKLIYTYDNLKYDYQYVDGFKSQLNLQYVISPEDTSSDFIVGWNDFLYYKRIQAKGNWATRIRVGLSSNDETPFAPFAVDNNLNLRGVGNIIDRGTGVIIINTEYRHTILENNWCAFQTNVFIDAGTWRNPGGDFNDFTDNNNIRVFPGAGIRFIHKSIFNLVLRADFGYGVTDNEPYGIVFGVGQYF